MSKNKKARGDATDYSKLIAKHPAGGTQTVSSISRFGRNTLDTARKARALKRVLPTGGIVVECFKSRRGSKILRLQRVGQPL